jgi:hypothetical protein
VVGSFASSCTVAAAPGLISDIACALPTGAAMTRNAPTAAKPRTFVPFIPLLLHLKGFHASAVRLLLLQLPRRDAEKNLERVT